MKASPQEEHASKAITNDDSKNPGKRVVKRNAAVAAGLDLPAQLSPRSNVENALIEIDILDQNMSELPATKPGQGKGREDRKLPHVTRRKKPDDFGRGKGMDGLGILDSQRFDSDLAEWVLRVRGQKPLPRGIGIHGPAGTQDKLEAFVGQLPLGRVYVPVW